MLKIPSSASFDNPTVEQEYIESARLRRSIYLKYVVGLGIATLVTYFVLNPLILPTSGVNQFNYLAVPLLAVLTAYFFLLRTKIYVTRPWIDLVLFVGISLCMAAIATTLGGYQTETGWPSSAVITGNTPILVGFTILAFVASVRWYFIWLIFELVVYFYAIRYGAGVSGFVFGAAGLLPTMGVAFLTNYSLDRNERSAFLAARQLDEERAHTERLLYNVLPQFAAERLKAGEIVADAFSEATVVFVDLVGSANLTRTLSPGHLLSVLNRVFGLADSVAAECGLEKVKTIGDAYLAIAGTHSPGKASDAVRFAKTMVERIKMLSAELDLDLQVRIGLHTGPVIGGVIGDVRMAYDYWGDTMNVASRIQSVAAVGGISVSRQTYYATRSEHEYGAPRVEILKGIGETEVFDVKL